MTIWHDIETGERVDDGEAPARATSQHSPHPDLKRVIVEPDFEVWVSSYANYDEAMKLHPTAVLYLSGWGDDTLPRRRVTVAGSGDFGALASNEPERIIVRWPPEDAEPHLRVGWFWQLVSTARRTGHHTIVLIDGFNDLLRTDYIVTRLRRAAEQTNRRSPAGGA